jgi:hypothetical protein
MFGKKQQIKFSKNNFFNVRFENFFDILFYFINLKMKEKYKKIFYDFSSSFSFSLVALLKMRFYVKKYCELPNDFFCQ